jgi:hypothetical protein
MNTRARSLNTGPPNTGAHGAIRQPLCMFTSWKNRLHATLTAALAALERDPSPEPSDSTSDGSVRVAIEDLAALLTERCALRAQVTSLQTSNSAFEARARKAEKALAAQTQTFPMTSDNARTSATPDRDDLGRMVREAWVAWAKEQCAPKPSWLAPYDDLSEADKEADRRIGKALYSAGLDAGVRISATASGERSLVGNAAPQGDGLWRESSRRGGLWRYHGIAGGKYLVQRRDGSVPEWPFFVLGARDAAAPAALRAYAVEAEQLGFDPQYVVDVRRAADEFEAYRARCGVSVPDAAPERPDDPATVAKMPGAGSL